MILKQLRVVLQPLIVDDTEKTRVASFLHGTVLGSFSLLMFCVLMVTLTVTMTSAGLVISLLLAVIQLASLWLARRGIVKMANVLYVTFIWFLSTSVVVFFGGLSAPIVVSYAILLMVSSHVSCTWNLCCDRYYVTANTSSLMWHDCV